MTISIAPGDPWGFLTSFLGEFHINERLFFQKKKSECHLSTHVLYVHVLLIHTHTPAPRDRKLTDHIAIVKDFLLEAVRSDQINSHIPGFFYAEYL